jgi:hypothetical protein
MSPARSLPRDKAGEKDDAFAIVVSGADRRLIALRNGEEFINADIGIEHPRLPLGTHVYLLKESIRQPMSMTGWRSALEPGMKRRWMFNAKSRQRHGW